MRKTRHVLFGVLLITVILASVQVATAFSSYKSAFNTQYSTTGTRLDTCGVCHNNPSGGGSLNSYGSAFAAQSGTPAQAFTNIEPLDSDGDGYSNIAEIIARTMPGDPNDHPAPAPVLTTITVTPSTASLQVSGTQTFTAAAKDQNGNPVSTSITWSSSNTAVGTINSAGAFTALAAGSTTIRATSGTVSGTASVTVTAPPPPAPFLTTITVSPLTASLVVGNTQLFAAAAKDQNGNPISATITWSSSNTTVGVIDSTGRFTAVAAGVGTITARSGTVSGTASVTVTAPAPTPAPTPGLTTITVSPSTVMLAVGGTYKFNATATDQNGNPMAATITWSSSNSTVGTVDSTGKFTALAAGIATVRASSGTVTGTAAVTVMALTLPPPPAPAPTPVLTVITVSPSTASLVVGGTQTFTAATKDQNGNPISAAVTWSSSNVTVGTIDGSGKFTALAAGTSTITASSSSVSGTASVTVTAPATSTPPSSEQTFRVTFVIVDAETGKPVHEARVTLDGVTKETKHGGQVTFKHVKPGNHTYTVVAEEGEEDEDGQYQQSSGIINISGSTAVQVKLTPIEEHEDDVAPVKDEEEEEDEKDGEDEHEDDEDDDNDDEDEDDEEDEDD